MVEITDGPAAGATLMLRRAPRLLRVTVRHVPESLFDAPPEAKPLEVDLPGGKLKVGTYRTDVDALDQPTDTPDADEAVHVYRRLTSSGMLHVSMHPRSESGTYAIATYQWLRDVDGEQLRDRNAWEAWATLNAWRSPAPEPKENPA